MYIDFYVREKNKILYKIKSILNKRNIIKKLKIKNLKICMINICKIKIFKINFM